MRFAQCLGPMLAEAMEIGLPWLYPIIHFRVAGVWPRKQDINRHADPEVRAHGRIHRNQCQLERIVKVGLVGDGTVQYWLAVFVLADLQIRRIRRAFDEVTRRIDHEEPQFLARLGVLGREARLRERVSGIPIGRVRRLDIGIYSASP